MIFPPCFLGPFSLDPGPDDSLADVGCKVINRPDLGIGILNKLPNTAMNRKQEETSTNEHLG